MANNPQQPREYDAVLGGHSPSLESAAVLGGIEGVKSRLSNPDQNVRIATLGLALSYGEQGLDLVIQALNDESWDVQDAAYSLLNTRTETKVKQALRIFTPARFRFETVTVNTGHQNYEGAPNDGSPWFDDNNLLQKRGCALLRGGSWLNNPVNCRSAFRHNYNRDNRNEYFGFRLVCAVERILQ